MLRFSVLKRYHDFVWGDTGLNRDKFGNSVLNGQTRFLKFRLNILLKNRDFENVGFGSFNFLGFTEVVFQKNSGSLFRCLFFETFFLTLLFSAIQGALIKCEKLCVKI